jgi:molybdate transport system ATP-binding protein
MAQPRDRPADFRPMTLTVSLRHRFPGLTLDLDFEAPSGLTVLFGRSGSGKTSIVHAVAGLLRPDSGRITANGAVLLDTARAINLPPHKRRLGYVFQEARLFPHLTVAQNLAFGRWFAPKAPDQTARIVALLGIGPLLHRRPAALSGGERQRVALGRAILSNPRLLAMDEPLAALDEARKAEILPYLERLRDETQLPILYVTHSAAELARLATTVVLIEAGRVTRAGPAAELLADPTTAPALGLREVGAILVAKVAAQEGDGLTRLDTSAGPLWLPRLHAPLGHALRIRILAQDVLLALERPSGISALNILPATITNIRAGEGPGALVQLQVGREKMLARITQRSATSMNLQPGLQVHCVLKAVSVAPQDIGEA